MLDVFDHQDMPFELLVRELQLPRDANRSPLFSIMFNMLNTPPGVVDFGGVTCSRLDFDKQASQFDLTVTVDAIHDRSICFEYSTDIFTSSHDRATREPLYADTALGSARRVDSHCPTLSMLAEDELELLSSWGTGQSLTEAAGR